MNTQSNMNKTDFYCQIVNEAPFGYAHLQLLTDKDGKPYDYLYRDINKAFEKLTGLKKESLIGNTLRQIFPQIMQSGFDWITFLGKIALEGGQDETEQYSEPLNKWYLVQVFTTERMFVSAMFFDSTDRQLTKEKLHETAMRLRLANKATSDVIWDWNITNDIQQWNDAGSKVFGWTDIVEHPVNAAWWLDKIHPDDRQRIHDSFFSVLKNPALDLWQDNYRFLKSNGVYADVFDRGFVIRNQQGEAIRMVGAMLDITERKLAVEALQKSEKKYHKLSTLLRLMADNMPDMLWAKNLNKEFIFANKAICEVLLNAKDTEEPLGKTDLFFANRERSLHPENSQWHTFGEICRDSDTITLGQLKPMQFDEFGNVKGKFLFLDVHKSPLYDDNGQLIGIVGSARDVTVAKSAEDRLRILSFAMEQSPASVLITNTQGEIEYVNQKFIDVTGYTLDDAIGKNPRILGSGEQPAEMYEELWNTILAGKEWKGEIHSKKKNGELFWESVHISPVKNNKGEITHFLAIKEDITDLKQQAEKLKESETKHRRLIAQMQEGLIVDNLDGLIQMVNPMFCKMTGFDESELLGKSGYNLMLSPDNILKMKERDNERLKNINGDYELDITTKNGETKTLWFHASPIVDENDIVSGSMSTIIDITEKKQLEKELHQQTLLRDLLMEIAAGFINIPFHKVDESINDALRKMALFVNADRSYTFDYDWENNICTNTYEWCAGGISQEIDNLQQVPLDMMQDWVECHKKGEAMYVPDVFALPHGAVREILQPQGIKSVLAVPMMNEGKCIGFVGFDSVRNHHNYSVVEQQLLKIFAQSLANIKMRKDMLEQIIAAKNKAEENERKLRESQAIAKLGSWELDVETGIFTFTDNLFEILHTTAEAMGGYQITAENYAKTFLVPEEAGLVALETQKAIETGDGEFSNYIEHQIRYYDGGTGYVGVRYFIIKDEKGKTIKTYGVNQDITARKETEKELIAAKEKAEESNRLKTHFINNISHEIRTPLNAIMGFGGLMMDENQSQEEKLENYRILNLSSNRLQQTITDIMDISELKAGTIKSNPDNVDILLLMKDLTEKTKSICSKKNIVVTLEIPTNYKNTLLYTDKELLQKIMMHLLVNAEKFTTEGRITLGFEISNKWITFCVKDTGKGILPDKLEVIFEPFMQEETAITRGHEGSGLGLSIARGIAELMGGRLWAESQKSLGSAFYFTLPLLTSKPEDGIKNIFYTNQPNSDNPVILVAEDDEASARLLQIVLQKSGFGFLHAWNGAEAIDFCKKYPEIALVIMDVKMPVINGLEATQNIKTFRPGLPIIALTAYTQTGDRQRIIEAGCDEYLAKPIRVNELKQLIKKIFLQ